MSRQVKKTTVTKTTTKTVPAADYDDQDVRPAFELFEGVSSVDPKELKTAMENLGYDVKNKVVYQIINELDTPDNSKGVDLDKFVGAVNDKFQEKDSKENLDKVFEIFTDGKDYVITVTSLTKAAKDLGEDLDEETAKIMLTIASGNKGDLSFDEFYQIMVRKN